MPKSSSVAWLDLLSLLTVSALAGGPVSRPRDSDWVDIRVGTRELESRIDMRRRI